jgi:integrase
MPADLTSDNLLLSRPNCGPPALQSTALTGTGLPKEVAALVQNSIAENTRRAYLSDLAQFESWGGCIPATDTMLASYIAAHAETLTVATLMRRLVAISKAHEARGLHNPVRSALVRATLRGIKRKAGMAQRQAKPLVKEDLILVLDAMSEGLRDARDRALLLVGFAGGFRRSELVGINREDIELVRFGIVIHLRKSKTDQMGAGRKVAIPHGRTRWCPVAALEEWLARSGTSGGPVFRPVERDGKVSNRRLSGEAVSLVIKERVQAAGIDPTGYSGHSLRAGFATSAAQAGVSSRKIRQQTGHASDATLARYIRDGELFADNAAGALL